MTLRPPTPRLKACAHCKRDFMPSRPMQKVCSPLCASRLVRTLKKQEREQTRARKEAIQTIPDLIKLADKAFADFIRTRDRMAGHPCISSGKTLDWSGNKVDAGHYRTRGAASHLRYHEDNCHAQTKQENQWKAGNVVEYRIRLIERIGLERVEALEADNEPTKWTREGLREVISIYRAKKKQLEETTE